MLADLSARHVERVSDEVHQHEVERHDCRERHCFILCLGANAGDCMFWRLHGISVPISPAKCAAYRVES